MVKVERSFPAPASLKEEAAKKNGNYSEKDVVERLKEDFHDKCYICELKELQDPQIEHLLPHKNGKYPERKFDWNNLFWVCGHCNSVKNQSKYDDGIIDCCQTDPESKIIFHCNQENIELISKVNPSDQETERTMMLIAEVFNLKNTGMRVEKSSMRFKSLQKEMNLLFDNLELLRNQPDSKLVKRKLKALLRRSRRLLHSKERMSGIIYQNILH
nr:hypothetical protein [uncultured Mediterraneibacter sp.]